MTNTKKLEILVVEDNPIHQQTARDELFSEGNIAICSNYLDAVSYLNSNSPDLVLTDERFPLKEGSLTALPLGSKIVLSAIARNVPYVALITDANHHSDEIAAASLAYLCVKDEAGFPSAKIGNTSYLENYHLCREGKKNYLLALRTLLKQDGGLQLVTRD